MAGSSPLSAFNGAAASTDAQKNALASLIAAQGSAGAESFKAEQAVQQKVAELGAAGVPASNPGIGKPNMASAVGPGGLTEMLAARAAQPGQLGAQQMGQAGTEFTKYAGLLGQANTNYGDAVKGAIPIVQAQAGAEVAKIQAELAMRREERQAQLNAQEEDRRWQEKTRGWQEDDRAYEERKRREEEALASGDGPRPYGAHEAGSSFGWSNKKTDTVRRTDAYNAIWPKVVADVKALGPAADLQTVRSIVYNYLHTPYNDQGDVFGNRPDVERLIIRQFSGLFDQALPTYRSTGGGGGGGGGLDRNPDTNTSQGAGPNQGTATLRSDGGSILGTGVNPAGRLNYGLGNSAALSDKRIKELASNRNLSLTQAERKVLLAEMRFRGIKL